MSIAGSPRLRRGSVVLQKCQTCLRLVRFIDPWSQSTKGVSFGSCCFPSTARIPSSLRSCSYTLDCCISKAVCISTLVEALLTLPIIHINEVSVLNLIAVVFPVYFATNSRNIDPQISSFVLIPPSSQNVYHGWVHRGRQRSSDNSCHLFHAYHCYNRRHTTFLV